MVSTRRTLIQLGAGASLGFMASPIPWRLFGDSAMWTQNWSWTPKIPRGPITKAYANCTLCPAGCSLRTETVKSMPVGLWPGAEPLCPAGFTGHHLAWHPQRLTMVRHMGESSEPAKAMAALEQARKRISETQGREQIAVLDLLPGRTASLGWRRAIAAIPGSRYLQPPAIEGDTAKAIATLVGSSAQYVLDLSRCQTLLALGTPVHEGWASPSVLASLKPGFRLLLASDNPSRTADLAAEVLPAAEQGQVALLLGLIHQWLPAAKQATKLAGYEILQQAASGFTAEETATRTGLKAERINALAVELISSPSAAILADGDPANGPLSREVVGLAAAGNALLGAIGRQGGYLPIPNIPAPRDWDLAPLSELTDVADGSLGLLLIDDPVPGASLPWALVQRKLAPGATVMAFTAWTNSVVSNHAEWQIPVPVFLEGPADVPAATDQPMARFRVSSAFHSAPAGVEDPMRYASALAGGPEWTLSSMLEQRSASIQQAGQGQIRKPGTTEFVEIGDCGKPEEIWMALKEGGAWQLSSAETPHPSAALLPKAMTVERLIAAAEGKGAGQKTRYPGWRPASVSPLLARLWQESDSTRQPGSNLSESAS